MRQAIALLGLQPVEFSNVLYPYGLELVSIDSKAVLLTLAASSAQDRQNLVHVVSQLSLQVAFEVRTHEASRQVGRMHPC